MFMQIVEFLSWLAAPVAILCVIDDWFLRPRRQIAAAPQPAKDPASVAVAYLVLPALVTAAVIRLLVAERLDFSLVLVLIAAVSGVIWALDAFIFKGLREQAAGAKSAASPGVAPLVTEPGTVDYARSFFPVAVIVLLLRSFIFEPFRIPSDSMMPTLLDGDFIVVNKYAYGLRLPVLNRKFLSIDEPQRGDIVVFRFPPDPSINYIKRLVGLPGDRVTIRSDQIVVNGVPVPLHEIGRYSDGCYVNMRLAQEQLGKHSHETMYCHTPGEISVDPLPGCNRHQPRSYVCDESGAETLPDRGDRADMEVPTGSYLMIGDNRDNSADGRYWGFVPEDHLVGKATRIWFNWDLTRSGGPRWSRIGTKID
jgi:signal peptidase I